MIARCLPFYKNLCIGVLVVAATNSVESVEVCKAHTSKYNATTVHYVKFTLADGKTLSGGKKSSECRTLSNSNYPIVGFRGRSGSELDALGVIFETARSL